MALHRDASILPIKSAVKKPSQASRAYNMCETIRTQKNSMEFFGGKALALQTLKRWLQIVKIFGKSGC